MGIDYNDTWNDFGALDDVGALYLDFSSVGAYYDTVIVLFDHLGNSTSWIKYRISYNGGGAWAWGFVGDTTVDNSAPNVTSRGGEGMAVTYLYWDGANQNGMFTWRDYPVGAWTQPFDFSDYEPRFFVKPAIEIGLYGIVYADYPLQNAYIDCAAWVGIAEDIHIQKSGPTMLHANYPDPFSRTTRIAFTLNKDEHVVLDIHNVSGQSIVNKETKFSTGYNMITWDGTDRYGRQVPPGIYFYRLTAGTFTGSGKLTLLR